ncbi:Transposable element P transposase [Amphibalanus amphitrite]|nr:Transposable element P transposase [Amphibalanus amphitrite]
MNIDGRRRRCAYGGHALISSESEVPKLNKIGSKYVSKSVIQALGMGDPGKLAGRYLCHKCISYGRSQMKIVQSPGDLDLLLVLYARQRRFVCGADQRRFVCGPRQRRFVCGPRQRRFVCGADQRRFVCGPRQRRFVCGPRQRRFVCGADQRRFVCGADQRRFVCGADQRRFVCGPRQRRFVCGPRQRRFVCGADQRRFVCGPRQRRFVCGADQRPSACHPETLAYSWSSTPAAPARAAPSEAPTRAAPSEAPASVSTPARAAPSEAPASVSTCGTPSVAAECGDLNVATPIRPHRSNASGHTPSSRRPGYDRPPSVRTPLHCRLWKGDLTISQRRCASLKAEKRELTAELRRERRRHRAEERRWRAEEKRLRTQLSDAEDAVTQLKSALGGIFSDRQLTTLRTGRRVNWEQQDIVRALVIRCCSRKCYQLLKDKFQFPLPGLSTLRRWTRGFRTSPGILDMALQIMRSSADTMTSHERLLVMSFDEITIDPRVAYDSTDDAVYGPNDKMQVVMVRSLCSRWKQPVFFDYNKDVTKDLLHRIIAAVESAGYVVVAMVCDLGPANRKLLWSPKAADGLGIDPEDGFFAHPCDPSRKIFTFADVPHLLKLLRNHILRQGLQLPGGPVIDKKVFCNLLEKDNSEFRLCHFLKWKHITVRGQECQRVYLAAQLLSERVAKAVSHIFGDRYRKEAEFIALVDQAFDTFNSRHVSDGKLHRSAFGLAHTIEDQYSCLLKFTKVMRDARVVGSNSMLPFQKGFVMSSTALRGLYSAVQRHHGLSYLLTSRLNQDCVENFFSQLRGMGAANTNPTAVEAKNRLRLLLIGAAPTVAAATHDDPRESGASVLLEEKEPTYLSATTLDLDHEPPVEPEVPDADVTAVENLVTARQPCPGPAASAGAAPPPASLPSGATGVASLSRQALAYVAGYVAAKCATVDSTLGKITSDASEVPRDERYAWIDTLSRGGLTVP